VGKTKHPVGLWATVISGTAVSAVLVSVALTQPVLDRFGDPTRYTSIYEQTQVEAWGAHPIDTFVDRRLASMTLEQKIRSLIIANQPGTDPAALQSFVSVNDLGGFILMGSNVPESPGELAGITSAITGSAELPRLIGIDEEGGLIKRLPYDGYAGADTLRNEPVSSTLSAFTSRGELLSSVGVNLNFGVVADVSSDPQSFIYGRSFGGDPTATAERVVAAVQGEDSSVLSTIKHFPGHGSAPGDSHVGVPTSPLTFDQWLATDAVPFQAGIDAGSSTVMFGHLAFPAVDPLPSSLSPLWHKILREQLGFTGVIITDDMTMLEHSHLPEYENRANNAVLALAAGNDVLLYVPGADFDSGAIVSAVVAAVQSGQLSEADIDDSARRVLTLRRELFPEAESWIPPCDERCFIWVTY
jgi:beta-N-acetylhexosaminidase